MSPPLLHPDGRKRCPWPKQDPLYVAYHDEEWGVPEYDDRALFEKLLLDGFQAGLSWITILRKRDAFRKAFRGSEFLYTLRLASGELLMAHVPSHHDHKLGEWIGIRAEVDHVVTFNRACPVRDRELCQLPCKQGR